MAVNTPGTTTTFKAGGAITKRRFVKVGAADDEALLAAAATDKIIGVSTDIDSASGNSVDVIRSDIAPIEYGAAVTRGDPLTADALGRAVVAAPAAGANNRIGGFAEISGVLGDIGAVNLAPGFMQG